MEEGIVGIESVHQNLAAAVALSDTRAVLRMTTTYQPAGGGRQQDLPAHLPRSRRQPPYATEPRFVDGHQRVSVVLDQVPSQANRAEEALLRATGPHSSGCRCCRSSTAARNRWC